MVKDADGDVAELGRAVPEAGALDSTSDALVFRGLINLLHSLERFPHAADAFPHDLTRGERVSGVEDVPFADVPVIHADLVGEDVHHAFHGELRLVAAEPTHRAARRIVRVDGARLDVDVRHPVRAARMARGAEQAFAARPGITASIADNARANGQQMSLCIGGDLELQVHRVTLDVVLGRLLARQDRLDGLAEEEGRHCRLCLDRQLLFRTESAPARRKGDLHVFLGQIQDLHDLLVVEHGALTVAMDLDAFALRVGEARFRLEERRLNGLRGKRPFDHVRRGGKCRLDVATAELDGVDQIRAGTQRVRRVNLRRAGLERLERVGDRLENFVVDLDLRGGLARMKLRVGHDHRHEVADAAGDLADSDK